jgi:hypothetical protein
MVAIDIKKPLRPLRIGTPLRAFPLEFGAFIAARSKCVHVNGRKSRMRESKPNDSAIHGEFWRCVMEVLISAMMRP